jgi:phosphate starvation-inducible PhoH-like protein
MFLTRIGKRSKAVITGDLSQTDLPHSQKSGLADAVGRLDGVDGVQICRMSNGDIVRHEIVQRIIDAYQPPESPKDPPTA